MRRMTVAMLAICVVLGCVGCGSISNSDAGSGGGGQSLGPISIALTGTASSVAAGGAAINVTANVSNDGSGRGVQWYLQVPSNAMGIPNPNCSPTCGTLSAITPFTVTYTPPPTVPGSLLVPPAAQPTDFSKPMLVAVSIADNSKSTAQNFSITGNVTLGVQITNPFASIGTQDFAIDVGAALTNDVNNLGVTWYLTNGSWTVGKPTCGGTLLQPAFCGEILNPSLLGVVYVPGQFPYAPMTNPPTITAVSNSDITKSASFTFTITQSSTVNMLNGQYAFLLHGFDSAGKPLALAGSFTANGTGKLSLTAVDLNDDQNVVLFGGGGSVGAYYMDSSSRGNIAVNQPSGSNFANTLNFAYTLSADGTRGTLISFDANNNQLNGAFELQDPTAFTLHGINNDYVFKLDSNLPDRYDAVGKMSIDLNQQINVYLDTSRTNYGPSLVNAQFTGSLQSIPDSNGRGLMSFAGHNFVYYVVSSNTLYLLQIDNSGATNALWTGLVKFQKIQSFTPATVNATSVFHLTGLDITGAAPEPVTAIGTLNISGNTNAALLWDANAGGGVFANMSSNSQDVTFVPFNPAVGRGTFSISNGRSQGLVDSFVFYLADSGEGFLLDTTVGTANRALIGDLHAQVGSGTFGNGSLSGNLLIGTAEASSVFLPVAEGLAAVSGNNLTGTTDYSLTSGSAASPRVSLNPVQAFSATVSNIDANTGRGSGTLPGYMFNQQNQSNPTTVTIYLYGPNQFVAISSQTGATSAVNIFGPQ